jgi:hypothetical protein
VADGDVALSAARSWWPLGTGIVLGIAVGLLVSLVGSSTHRAEASVLISSPAGPTAVRPLLPNLRELATSSVVAGNVRSTLRLSESPEQLRGHLKATVRPASQVIAVSATDQVADHARQVAQETAVVFGQLVEARFGTGKPELHAAVLDSAHVLGGPDRHFARNLLIGGLLGLLVGSAAMFVLASRRPPAPAAPADDSDLRRREELLAQRVSSVGARERALATHAGQLAARERELDARAARVDASRRELEAREEAPPRPQPPPPPPPPLEPVPAPPETSTPARLGAWNLNDLQRALDAHTGASPEEAEELRAYLYFLRAHASSDGSLPRSFDGLVSDVFGDLLDRK